MATLATETTPFVRLKGIEAKSHKKRQKHNQPRERPPLQIYAKAGAMVDELEKLYGITIKGNKRRILESVSRLTFQNQPATNSAIDMDLSDMSLSSIEKMTYRLCKDTKFLLCLSKREGHENQFVLSNMQDFVKDAPVAVESKQEADQSENLIVDFFVQVVKSKPNPEFHRITLMTELADAEDYYHIHNWKIC
ncbi:MAG: hypothetical protein ACTHME_00760, partial [Candidatus Nitrosocosmicus sp.]